MRDSRREDILLGLFTLGVIAALVMLSLRVGTAAPPGAVTYDFIMDGVLGLQKDNRVTIAGVQVGVVEGLVVDGRKARLTLAVDPSVKLYTSAKAAVRARTLLGEKYVDLDPGVPPSAPLEPGATVVENVPTLEIDSVIRGAAELVATLNEMTPSLRMAADRLQGVLETADMRQVARDLSMLIRDSDEFVRSLQRSLGDSSSDMRVLLQQLRTRTPDILTRLDHTTQKVDKILSAIPENSLAETLKKTPPMLDSTQQTLVELREVVAELRSTSQRSQRVMENLDKILARAADWNEQKIREVLQVEGVRVNLITDPDIERRVRALAPVAPRPAPR